MQIDESFVLKKGKVLILKKKKGHITIEFSLRNEKHLDGIIEVEYKNPRSKKKDPSSWITDKDFIRRVMYEIESEGFEFYKLESKKNQNDSK